MSSLKRHFAAVALTTSMAFNALAADTPDVVHYESVLDPQDSTLIAELDNEDLFGLENNPASNEHILPLLVSIETRRDAVDLLNTLRNNPKFEELNSNIVKVNSLDGYLDFSGTSPYLALPLLIGREQEKYLNTETITVLEKHGLDIAVLDQVIQARMTGQEVHLYDFVGEKIERELDSSYLMAQAQHDGHYANIPQELLSGANAEIDLYTRARRLQDPEYSAPTLQDIVPLGAGLVGEANPIQAIKLAATYADPSYETALEGRERNFQHEVSMNLYNSYQINVEEHITASYKGYDSQNGIFFTQAEAFSTPQQRSDFSLIVVEPNNHVHSDITHRYAEQLALKISPDQEGEDDVYYMSTDTNFNETDSILAIASYGANNIILSKSYGYNPSQINIGGDFQRNADPTDILKYNFHEQNSTIQFIAAGNSYSSHVNPDETPDIFDAYKNITSVSAVESHAQRSVTVGAAHVNGDTLYMPSYTSTGADFLMETPDFYGAPIQGTSFSTPTAAEYYHQIAESFSDTLTHEEIMIAALYSTDLNVHNVTMEKANALGIKLNKEMVIETSGQQEYVRQFDKTLSADEIKSFPDTTFRTNDAGIPFHERAGAGYLSVDKWVDKLNTLTALKSTFEHEAAYISEDAQLSAPKYNDGDDAVFKYTYTIDVNQDMTLDKQTLFLAQAGLNNIRITTPAGMQADFAGSLSGYVSTRAFSGEDVQVGDKIRIETNSKLTEQASFTLRGFEDGNAIQALRGYIQNEQGLERNALYEGSKLSEQTRDAASGLEMQRAQVQISAAIDETKYPQIISVGPQPF
tara:strand:- start:495449 stop:497872 length:2424 start_codon:yes stop_codon:yes gene_type:complete